MQNKSYQGSILVICAYMPKPGKEADLQKIAKEHVPILRSVWIATKKHPQIMKSDNSTIVEVFEWHSSKAIEEAHKT